MILDGACSLRRDEDSPRGKDGNDGGGEEVDDGGDQHFHLLVQKSVERRSECAACEIA